MALVEWPVTLGGKEITVDLEDTATDQEIMAAAVKKLGEIGGPNMGPIPVTAEGKVPSAPYVTEAHGLAGVEEGTVPRALQSVVKANDLDTPGGMARYVALNALAPGVAHVGGAILGNTVVPAALRATFPKVGRVLDPAARWIGETATGLGFGKALGEVTEAPDSDTTALQGGVMGALQRPVAATVRAVSPYIKAFTENVRGTLPPSPTIPGASVTVRERALQIMEERAGLAPGTLSPKTPREIAAKEAEQTALAADRKRWETMAKDAKTDAAAIKAEKAEADRAAAVLDRDRRQAEIATERARLRAVKEADKLAREQARQAARDALTRERADKLQYKAGYEMEQALVKRRMEEAADRMTVQATDNLTDLTERVFDVPKGTGDLHDLLIGIKGSNLANEAYGKGLETIEKLLPVNAKGERVVKWLVADPKTGAMVPVERVAGGKGGAFDELSKLGQKSYPRGTKVNREARELYELQRDTIFDSMSPEAQSAFGVLQAEYAQKRGLAGLISHIGEALNMDTLMVDIPNIRRGIGRSDLWQTFQRRFGEQEANQLKRMFGVGSGPMPDATKGPFVLPPRQSP